MRICAIIPAYNEEKTIESVIQKIPRDLIEEIFVICDGSTDKTAEIARKAGAKVIIHPINRGVGAAQRTGYKVAIIEGFDYIVQLDADGQHDPKYIKEMIKTALSTDADIVIASRFLNESYKQYSFIRRIGIMFFTKLVSIFGKVRITDVTSGYRVYKVSSLKKLGDIPDKNWAVTQTLEAAKKRMKIVEISVEMPPRRKGKSQFDPLTFIKYPFRMIKEFIRVLLFRV